jgi:hypothetical protein
MSRSIDREAARNVALGLGAVALAAAGIAWARDFVRLDPFARLKAEARPLEEQVGIRLNNVQMRHYKGGKLVAEANIDELEVRKDRQRFDLHGVRDGVFHGEGEGDRVKFVAEQANYDIGRRSVEVTKGARVANKDLDLQTEGFVYDQKRSEIKIPNRISGSLMGGQVQADEFRYTLGSGAFGGANVHWVGRPAKVRGAQDLPVGGSSEWHITAEDVESPDGKINVYSKATASDGEVRVRADRIEHDPATDVLTATGSVQYFSQKANLVCEKVVVYRKERRAVLTGSVQMLFKPKKDQGNAVEMEIPPFRPIVPEQIARNRPAAPGERADDEVRSTRNLRDYPVQLAASRIEYWYAEGQRRAKIEGSPQARQELPQGRWRHLWTHEAFYDGEKETLRLVSTAGKSDTRVITSRGDDMAVNAFSISTQENNEWFKGEGFKGRVYSDDENLPRSGGGSAAPPPE